MPSGPLRIAAVLAALGVLGPDAVAQSGRPAPSGQFPARKAGQWETAYEPIPGQSTPPGSVACLTPAVEDKTGGLLASAGVSCKVSSLRSMATGFDYVLICDIGGGKTTTRGTLVGDLNSQFTQTDTAEASFMGQRTVTKSKAISKWVGECRPGLEPGDVILDSGQRYNLLTMLGTAARR